MTSFVLVPFRLTSPISFELCALKSVLWIYIMIMAHMDFSYSHVRLFDLLVDIEEAVQEYPLESHCITRAVSFAFGGGHL